MAKLSKRQKQIADKIDRNRQYGAEEAFALLKEVSTVKFNESVDVAVNLGVDPRRSDQMVRGSTVLPRGTGQDVRVAVFAQGANAEAATEAGGPAWPDAEPEGGYGVHRCRYRGQERQGGSGALPH
jgi:large subunit ribosomal protein L1